MLCFAKLLTIDYFGNHFIYTIQMRSLINFNFMINKALIFTPFAAIIRSLVEIKNDTYGKQNAKLMSSLRLEYPSERNRNQNEPPDVYDFKFCGSFYVKINLLMFNVNTKPIDNQMLQLISRPNRCRA